MNLDWHPLEHLKIQLRKLRNRFLNRFGKKTTKAYDISEHVSIDVPGWTFLGKFYHDTLFDDIVYGDVENL